MVQGLSRLLLSALLLPLVMSPRASRAEDGVAGLYVVQGKGVDGHPYEGVAQISAAGKTYEIAWQIGKDTYRGRGIAHGKGLAFAFAGAGFKNANIALYEQAGAGVWCGVWTSDNADQVGQESLILRTEAAAPKAFDCAEITASSDAVDILERQVAWNQGDGDAQLADELGGQR